jgi:hypothetical protein
VVSDVCRDVAAGAAELLGSHFSADAICLGFSCVTQGNTQETTPRPDQHRFSLLLGRDDHGGKGDSATLRPVEDYTSKYKGEQVEVAMFGGDYHEGVLTAYCAVDEVAHIELNGHILIPLQNIASLHCTSRCDAPEPDWPPRGFAEDERDS